MQFRPFLQLSVVYANQAACFIAIGRILAYFSPGDCSAVRVQLMAATHISELVGN